MAGNTARPASIGVGSALRRARAIRGITVDDAVRDTKLRPEQVRALEDEDFEVLGGEVYVRATLRTYAQYLGLDPEKVVGAYARHADEPSPPPPPGKMGRVERAIAATRVRDNQRFLWIAAAVLLLTLVAVGLVSRRAAPPPGAIPTQTPTEGVEGTATPSIDVALTATAEVEVSAIADGEPLDPVALRPGEVVSFSAFEELTVEASDGGLVSLSVGGEDRGTPGAFGQPWSETFVPVPKPVPKTEVTNTEVTPSPSG
jgi:cytoskeletal protein RodZ